jgi:hypothetical protein
MRDSSALTFPHPCSPRTPQLLVDGLLLRSLPSAIYTSLFYWLLGMRPTASAFCIALGVVAAFTACVGALVMCLTNLLGSPGRTVVVTSVLLLVSALFGGFLVNKTETHWALRWITYASPTRWVGCVGVGGGGAPALLSLSLHAGATNMPLPRPSAPAGGRGRRSPSTRSPRCACPSLWRACPG